MIQQPRRRRRSVLPFLAVLMAIGWVALLFIARFLASDEKTGGYGAFVGFFVIAMSIVTYALFMMAVDSDKS